MYKEWIIIIIVIVLVLVLDIFTNQYLHYAVQTIRTDMNALKPDVLEENQLASQEKMVAMKERWKQFYDTLAYYIEHDELEKVATELTKLAAHIDVKDYQECISQIDTTIFILEHIEEKEKFDWKSIF